MSADPELTRELERLALALSQAYSRFADVVNLLAPAHDTYDTRLLTVQRAVDVCEDAIRQLPAVEV